ncbi:ATP-binding protein [Streptomyces sp. NBC_00879]|uniref:ATP-binding protein n=1 Tax=Streptomyces sp. NBC_00879 TaxID=2975855 RepID=UPI0038642BFE|nr:ATP-binding protein [Streptomyces sp. NBC_00879]
MTQTISDPKTVLQEHLGHNAVVYEYQHEGPDHAIVFRAVATDSRRREGEGTGRSKKAAAQQAALDFLQKYIPGAFTNKGVTATRLLPPREIRGPERHVHTVSRVQQIFSLPETSRPLLSQALIHASWAYENRPEMAKHNQQDYQALAFLGSQLLIFEHFLAIARHAALDPPEEFSFRGLPNEMHNEAFRKAGLSSGLLLGAGQQSKGIPEELGSDTFQAMIGAISAATDFQGALADRWPIEWGPVWPLVAPTAPLPIAPVTRLQQAMTAMKLDVRYEFRSSGPDHLRQYTATAIIDSPALGIHTKVQGTAAVGKTPARHQASLPVLRVLDRLSDHSPARSFDGVGDQDLSMARLLLAQQVFVLDASPVPVQRWVAERLFGFHLAADVAALLSWAIGVDELLDLNVPLKPSSQMWDAFRKAVELSVDRDDTLDAALASTMEALEQIEAPEGLSPALLQKMVRLCDVYRCLGLSEPDVSLPQLADDWQILHRGRLKVATPLPDVQLSSRDRALIDAALSTVIASREETSTEFLSVRPLHLRFRSSQPPPLAVSEEVCALWSRVSRTATMKATTHGIDVVVTTTDTPREPGPITQAIVAALHPRPEPYRAAVADLLHDLKNQLVAARLASSQPAEGRTAQLHQQLTASRHLDEAHALALRLQAATSSLKAAGSESVELGGFLRQYAAAVLPRLPGSISLSVPEARLAVHVALDARALTAALDNLVGNAIEALRDGGAITLAWTADEYEAIVEIADDGPGLPPEVAAALDSGDRVRSTKPGGNGLGLLGVHSLLGRVGGQLSRVPTSSGTAWLITLPVTPLATSELS